MRLTVIRAAKFNYMYYTHAVVTINIVLSKYSQQDVTQYDFLV